MDTGDLLYSEDQITTRPLGTTMGLQGIDMDQALEKDKAVEILKQTAASLHSFNAPNTYSMVLSSNSSETQEEVGAILKTHFHPLNLTNTQSVISFLLLTCFFLKKQARDADSLKKLYEDHISLLKDKNSELEEKLLREVVENGTGGGRSSGKMSPDCSMSPSTTEVQQDCSSCAQLKTRVEMLTGEVNKLQRSYDEVCHVNGQWARDYEALSKQVRDATNFSLLSSTFSSSSSSTSSSMQAVPPRAVSTAMSTSSSLSSSSSGNSCVHCPIFESQLNDRVQEVEDLQAQVVGLREDIKDCKERLNQKQQEMSCLESEYQILRIQVQEIGDLQLALNMKQEYRKMQRNLQQKTKLYQDAMCEKLDLQKQVEKLRQAFLKCFPIPAPLQAPPQVSMGSRPPASGSYYSFPLHSCRNNLQNSTIDSNPPTPPGLLARGDMRGGVVEKDDQMVPRIKLDQDLSRPSRIDRHTYGQQSRSLEHLDAMDTGARGRSLTEHNGPLGTSLSLSPGVLRLSDLALNNGMEDSYRRKETLSSGSSVSGDFVARSHSHSSTSSSVVNGVPKRSVAGSHSGTRTGTNGSHAYTTAIAYNGTSVPPAPMSSLGYGSNDSGSSMDSQSLNHTHRHAPYESRLRPAGGHSEMEVVNEREIQKPGKSSIGRSASFTTRPSSLALGPKPGVHQGSGHGGKAPFFYCPNCRQSFSCVGKDSFDAWFDHVKGCSA